MNRRNVLACAVLAAASGALVRSAHADVVKDYEQTKTFTFTVNNPAGVIPVLTGYRYDHAFFNFANGTGVNDRFPFVQPKQYNGFKQDEISRNSENTVTIYNPANGGPKMAPVNLQKDTLVVKKYESTVNPSAAGKAASASSNLTVSKREPGNATGSVTVSGGFDQPGKGQSAGSLAYGNVVATFNGVALRGTIKGSDGKQINVVSPRQIGQKTGAVDPIVFTVQNDQGVTLLSQMLYYSYAEVDGPGSLNWGTDELSVDAENANFFAEANPLGGPQSVISFVVSGGTIVSFKDTGTLFQSCDLTVGTTGPFGCVLSDQFTFNYNLSRFGSQDLNLTTEFSDIGFTSIAPEPNFGAVLGAGLGVFAFVAWRRRVRVFASSVKGPTWSIPTPSVAAGR
jgi:hypothetical protein